MSRAEGASISTGLFVDLLFPVASLSVVILSEDHAQCCESISGAVRALPETRDRGGIRDVDVGRRKTNRRRFTHLPLIPFDRAMVGGRQGRSTSAPINLARWVGLQIYGQSLCAITCGLSGGHEQIPVHRLASSADRNWVHDALDRAFEARRSEHEEELVRCVGG